MKSSVVGKISRLSLLAILSLAVSAGLFAQDDFSQGQGPIEQTVARVSYFSGEVSFSRGDDTGNWQPAAVNIPMTLGDRVYTSNDSKLELQVTSGNFIRLAPGSDLAVLNLTEGIQQFSLRAGTAAVRVRHLWNNSVLELDTPNVAITFARPGVYRVDVDDQGNTRVIVRRGLAVAASGGGQLDVDAGSVLEMYGIDSPQYNFEQVPPADPFDRWVRQRDHAYQEQVSVSASYVNPEVVGAADLDAYGRWTDIPNYGWAWMPTVVAAGWAPYTTGRWIWEDPWGWTWISAEPWGWAPFHYGRWVTSGGGWYWIPVRPSVRLVTYSPALVAFVGGGPGWNASGRFGGGIGYVGWFPLAPADPFMPWWGPRVNYVNVTNVTYVNRRYVTVVNQNTFVAGRGVAGAIVTSPTVVRAVAVAPVARGPIPVVPTTASLRVNARAGYVAARPPAAVMSRAVVTRVAPPPAPPSFTEKIGMIRSNGGAPVAAAVAARLSMQSSGGARAVVPMRPAAGSGMVTLAPRSGGNSAMSIRPQPVTAPRGRVLATQERPMVAAPAQASNPRLAPAQPMPVAPDAVRMRSERPQTPPPARGNWGRNTSGGAIQGGENGWRGRGNTGGNNAGGNNNRGGDNGRYNNAGESNGRQGGGQAQGSGVRRAQPRRLQGAQPHPRKQPPPKPQKDKEEKRGPGRG